MRQLWPKLTRREWLFVIALSLVFLVVASLNLTKLPIFVDEAIYLRWSQIAWHDASWRFISLTDGKQPLYIWFVIPFMKIFADPLFAGRMASVVSGLGTVLGMGYLSYLLGNKKTAFYALLLSALSPYLFFYYRFGVMESMLVAASLWTVNFSVILARTKRLDVALILGMVAGMTILVKSSALFFLLLIPFAYLLEGNFKKIFSPPTYRYLGLVFITLILAAVIYNVQRLSPWMHMIGAKNAFFTVPYNEIFKEPARLWNNFLDVWRWQLHYSTWPVSILALWGVFVISKKNLRTGLYTLSLLMIPVLGTVAIARLFAPRYIIYATPFVLLFASFALASIKPQKLRFITSLLVLLLPAFLLGKLVIDPINYPYHAVDGGYVNGWSAGNGTKQIADWAVNRVEETGGKVTVYTEGTFGILPHGLELFADGRVDGLSIIGIYPVNKIPPLEVVEAAGSNVETYLLMNNTPTSDEIPGLKLVNKYYKQDPIYSMRLFQVLPPDSE